MVVTTFAEGGLRTVTDEFVVPLGDDRVAVWTHDADRWRERLARSAVVSVQAADAHGRPVRTQPVLEGRAELVTEGDRLDVVRELTERKYGAAAALARAVDWAWELGARRSPSGAVVIDVVG